MEQRAITQMEKSKKMTKAEEKFRQAQAVYDQAVKDEKARIRSIQDRHKYMMGGCVLKYFPEDFNAYEFDEQEMNRIIACAFKNRDVQNMVKTVVRERPSEEQEVEKAEVKNEDTEIEENEEAEGEENEGGEA
ncbi:MAG: hypothetical protein J6I76_00590 [Oribacterium sp.]|nr:hypothetical protein [Oribacterium sp.]